MILLLYSSFDQNLKWKFILEEFRYHLKILTAKVYDTYLVVNELQKKFSI